MTRSTGRRRRVAAAVLCVVLAGALAACGGDDGDSANTDVTVTPRRTTPTTLPPIDPDNGEVLLGDVDKAATDVRDDLVDADDGLTRGGETDLPGQEAGDQIRGDRMGQYRAQLVAAADKRIRILTQMGERVDRLDVIDAGGRDDVVGGFSELTRQLEELRAQGAGVSSAAAVRDLGNRMAAMRILTFVEPRARLLIASQDAVDLIDAVIRVQRLLQPYLREDTKRPDLLPPYGEAVAAVNEGTALVQPAAGRLAELAVDTPGATDELRDVRTKLGQAVDRVVAARQQLGALVAELQSGTP